MKVEETVTMLPMEEIMKSVEQYVKEGKMQLIVGIGCTGGQHRSVTLTNFLADHYKKYYKVYKWHRDADH